MRVNRKKETPIVVAMLLIAPVLSAQAQGGTAKLVEQADSLGPKVERGNEKEPNGAVFGVATGVVEAPLEAVFRTVVDYNNYATFMPNFRKSKELSRRGNKAILYLEVAILKGAKTLWTNAKVYELKPRGKTRIIEAKMVKGKGNMGQFAARWELTPVDDRRTMVHFRVIVDPDLPVPDSLLDDQNMKAAYRAIKALRSKLGVSPK